MDVIALAIDNNASCAGGLWTLAVGGDEDRQLSANIETPEIADNYPIAPSHRLWTPWPSRTPDPGESCLKRSFPAFGNLKSSHWRLANCRKCSHTRMVSNNPHLTLGYIILGSRASMRDDCPGKNRMVSYEMTKSLYKPADQFSSQPCRLRHLKCSFPSPSWTSTKETETLIRWPSYAKMWPLRSFESRLHKGVSVQGLQKYCLLLKTFQEIWR